MAAAIASLRFPLHHAAGFLRRHPASRPHLALILRCCPIRLFRCPSPAAAAVAVPLPPLPCLTGESQDNGEDFQDEDALQKGNGSIFELPSYPSPNLSVKEKKELAAYAHGLGNKLKIHQVGKHGVTSNTSASFLRALEANELIKIKVNSSCPGELSDVVNQLEKATGSVSVHQIGRTLIIYRPSASKMKHEAAVAERRGWSSMRPRSVSGTTNKPPQERRTGAC